MIMMVGSFASLVFLTLRHYDYDFMAVIVIFAFWIFDLLIFDLAGNRMMFLLGLWNSLAFEISLEIYSVNFIDWEWNFLKVLNFINS